MSKPFKFQVNINDFEIIREIKGGGLSAKVYLVKNRKTKEELVAKVNDDNSSKDDDQKPSSIREATILMRIQHPTIYYNTILWIFMQGLFVFRKFDDIHGIYA